MGKKENKSQKKGTAAGKRQQPQQQYTHHATLSTRNPSRRSSRMNPTNEEDKTATNVTPNDGDNNNIYNACTSSSLLQSNRQRQLIDKLRSLGTDKHVDLPQHGRHISRKEFSAF